ncbi:MAG TPA: electron transport complex subunit RsxC [Firmicutes bacterium]|nr:electron transport complex subunit RsxC [Bacillota bacterium]
MFLKTFRKGIHLPGHKGLTSSLPIEILPSPQQVVLPLSQHIGAPAEPLVSVGDQVLLGQKIAEAQGMVSAPLHASVAGKIIAIEPRPHVCGKMVTAIVIENNRTDEWAPEIFPRHLDPERAESDEVREIMKEAGLVGMGGAAFPTHVKYNLSPDQPIDYVILNGAECEPFLTCDHRLMVEKPDRIVFGLRVMLRAAGASKGYIVIEENKPDAIAALNRAVQGYPIEVVPVKAKYPQGEERMIIYAATRRVVPVGALPAAVGVIVNNVATAFALAEFIQSGRPLISRIITVTGNGINQPKNLEVRIGTLLEDVLNYCGGFKGNPGRIILGGPLTGSAQYRLDLPIMKGTSGILVQTEAETPKTAPSVCIRCGKCVDACPFNLLPNFLGLYCEHDQIDKAEAYGVLDCRECGSCAYVCPARRPLTQMFKNTKNKIIAAKRKTS